MGYAVRGMGSREVPNPPTGSPLSFIVNVSSLCVEACISKAVRTVVGVARSEWLHSACYAKDVPFGSASFRRMELERLKNQTGPAGWSVSLDKVFDLADRLGVAWFWLSSPTGSWSGQHKACGTIANPMASCNANPDIDAV